MPKPTNVVAIPSEYSSHAQLEAVAHRYKQLRLTALKVDPEAFSSTYKKEAQFPDETWFARIQNPQARTFIALGGSGSGSTTTTTTDETSSDGTARLLTEPWVGQLTIVGPKLVTPTRTSENSPWEIFVDSDKKSISFSLDNDDELQSANPPPHALYILAGMFVHPDGRRKGNGLRLVSAAVAAARDDATRNHAERATVVVFAEAPNLAARRLYEMAGFTVRVEEWLLKSRDGESPVAILTMDLDLCGTAMLGTKSLS